MDIDSMIKEITEEVMKNIRTEDEASSRGGRNSAFDLPARRSAEAGYTSAYDLGPCADAMRRETSCRSSRIGGSAAEGNYSSRVNRQDFELPGRRPAGTGKSAYDYQTHL